MLTQRRVTRLKRLRRSAMLKVFMLGALFALGIAAINTAFSNILQSDNDKIVDEEASLEGVAENVQSLNGNITQFKVTRSGVTQFRWESYACSTVLTLIELYFVYRVTFRAALRIVKAAGLCLHPPRT